MKKKAHWPYAGHAGAVTTAGGLVFSAFADGTFAAFDDETMELKWKINLGAGFTAPPISFGVRRQAIYCHRDRPVTHFPRHASQGAGNR